MISTAPSSDDGVGAVVDPDSTGPAATGSRVDLFVILAIAFALRVAWCAYAARTPTDFGDPFAYLHHADEIARGEGYHTYFYGVPTAYYPVGYPGLLGVLLWAARLVVPSATAMQTAIVVNLACGVATVGLIYDLGRRIISPRGGRIAAAIVALFPSLILYTATAYTETVFTFLVVVVVWLLVGRWPSFTDPSWRRLAVLGVAFAGAALVRPVILAFVPVLFILWWATGSGWWRSLRSMGIVVVVVVVVVAPWSIRSTRALNGFVAISTNAGDDLCIGHSDQATGGYQELLTFCWPGYEGVPPDEVEVVRDETGTRRAIRYALSHPGREAELLARKAAYLFQHDHEGVAAAESYGTDPFLSSTVRTILEWTADAFYYVVAVAAIAGAVITVRRRDRRLIVVLALAVTLLAVPLAFFGGSRLHIPALPLVAVLAAVAADALRSRMQVRHRRAGHAAGDGAGRAQMPRI